MTSRRTKPALLKTRSKPLTEPDFDHALGVVFPICCIAGSQNLLDSGDGGTVLRNAIIRRDTPALYGLIAKTVSLQGVSDRAAMTYMEIHGAPTWETVQTALSGKLSCPLLRSYYHYEGCRYRKAKQTCARQAHFSKCPLPKMQLRNGRLNQTSFALFLFIRDVMDSDIVGWIGSRLDETGCGPEQDKLALQRESLIGPLREIIGLADKVISMTLSSLLLTAPQNWKRWRTVGGSMIAIDTLVHKFMHRTGILHRFGSDHEFGSACYRRNGCAEIIEMIASRIDARDFSKRYPQRFARWVQHAIWTHCSQEGLSECNSVRVKDGAHCANIYCRVYGRCDRRPVSKS